MRLLALEDDKTLGPWIEQGLREAGHVVDLFANGKDALIAATAIVYEMTVVTRNVSDFRPTGVEIFNPWI